MSITQEINEIVQIDIETILPNRAQPRTHFEPESLQRLAESIKEHGIIQPLTVRKLANKPEYTVFKYELVAGERRLRASKLIGLERVPCIIIETDTKTSAALAIIENLHRNDLNIFEEASAIASLIELYKLTQEQIAHQLSLTQAAIANKLRLLRLSAEEKSAILNASLSERHARALLKIKNQAERQKALEHIIKQHLNVKQTELYIDRLMQEGAEKAPTIYIKDYKLLISSISKAVESTRNGGITVKTAQTETEKEIIYTISIAKEAV